MAAEVEQGDLADLIAGALEATGRKLNYDSLPDLFRVVVSRMNMAGTANVAARGVKGVSYDFSSSQCEQVAFGVDAGHGVGLESHT